ncbi:Rieske 2Fe-2S domain-containing protein [Pseudomonas chlororaphis]|uniref:Rieske 2Fe-2S domain-containing protein n=1 Tax=Pseudomonas chlororaphis TaxID=587753 RepID=UPI000470E9BA|nr:Rieske 2Fe-2S domain-containing protein [Pseudomonas chlororaphis]
MSDIPVQELSDVTKMEREDLLHESSRPEVIGPDSADLIHAAASSKRSVTGETRVPLPYPDGWFRACFSRDLKRGAVLTVPFMGQELVLYRTISGQACAIDPYCPHMGAHLGGGKVQGEELVCPFHGLAFGPDGRCLHSGDGASPPSAWLTTRHMREINGAVMVWADHQNRPPSWEVPEWDLSAFAAPPQHTSQDLNGYCQDTGENSVDLVHFGWLHGLTEPTMTHEAGDYWFETILTASWKGQPMRMRMRQIGLGHVQAVSEMTRIGFRLTTMLYSTPTAPMKWTMSWIDMMELELFERWPRPLRKVAYGVLAPLAKRWLVTFTQADNPIWNARAYLDHPRLMKGDKGIAAFRRWATRFYPTRPADVQEDSNHPIASAELVHPPSEIRHSTFAKP